MTNDEFKRWWSDYQAKFPSVLGWFNDLLPEHQREQFAVWRLTLAKADLADALEVNRRMSVNEIPPVGSYPADRERTAYAILSECEALARTRQPNRRDDWENDRAKCRHCRDTGYVEVYRPKFLAFLSRLLDEGDSLLGWRQCGWRWGRPTQCVICSCEAGEEKIWHGSPDQLPTGLHKTRLPDTPRFNPEKFYRVVLPCDPHIDRKRSAEELVAEAEQREAEAYRQAAEWYRGMRDQQEPRYGEFDAWNRGDEPLREQIALEFKRP